MRYQAVRPVCNDGRAVTAAPEEITTPQFAHAVRGYDRFQVDEYVERLGEWATRSQARALELERDAAERREYVATLEAQLRELEARGPAAPEEAIQAAAERAAEAVGSALRAADEIRRRASDEAERRLDDAARQALEAVETARQSMAALSEESMRERAQAREQVESAVEAARRQADEERRRARDEAERLLIEGRARAAEVVADAEAEAEAVRQASIDERRQLEESLARLQSERAQIVGDLGRLRGAIQALIANSPVEGGELGWGGEARREPGAEEPPGGDPAT